MVECVADGRTDQQTFPIDGLGENEIAPVDFLALLRGGTVETLHTQEATLEDVFIRVTGYRLQESDA